MPPVGDLGLGILDAGEGADLAFVGGLDGYCGTQILDGLRCPNPLVGIVAPHLPPPPAVGFEGGVGFVSTMVDKFLTVSAASMSWKIL